MKTARQIFETEHSDVVERDRAKYNRTWANVPLAIKRWYADRADWQNDKETIDWNAVKAAVRA